eukprot:Skav218831  [mRNA]  locus=scaffold2959:124312:129237:+ [translate_table: standard]
MGSPPVALRKSSLVKLLVALLGLRLLATSFVGPAPNSSGRTVAMRAEEKEGEVPWLRSSWGLPSTGAALQRLSPEEYKMALEQEIETQRKNLGRSSWRPVDEKQLEKDARRTLKKNGIKDPSGQDVDMEQLACDSAAALLTGLQLVALSMRCTVTILTALYEDSEIELTCVDEDVMLAWAGGIPGTKGMPSCSLRPQGSTNYEEIATYDNMQNPQLLAKPYSGHEYSYTDSMVPPGKYDYRLLCRSRDGGITVPRRRYAGWVALIWWAD